MKVHRDGKVQIGFKAPRECLLIRDNAKKGELHADRN
jgi:sRNA-binding carbon storage regulator CsrA